jgi:hypothetical protein
MNRQMVIAGVLALAASVGSMAVSAAGGPASDVPERARGAKKIVVATATSVSPRWRTNDHGDQLIVSLIGLQVEETLKGNPSTFEWLEVEGGTLNGLTLRVSSISEIKEGERAVFFLDDTPEGTNVPHLKGKGVLKLDKQNLAASEGLSLDEIKRQVRGSDKK